MAKTQTAEVLLKYSVDSASANRVRQSFAELEYGLSDLRSELTGMGSSAQAGIANLRTRFVQGEQSVVAMQDEVEELRRELLALGDVEVTPSVNVRGGGGDGLVGGLNTLDQIGRIGTQVGGGLGASGLGNSVNLIGDIAGAAATMNPLLIGSAAAIGAVSLVTMELTNAYNDAREAAANYLAKQTEINLLLAQGDVESLEAQRRSLTEQLAAREATAEPLRALVDRFWELMQSPGSELGMTYYEITAELEKIPRQIYELTNGRIDNIQAAGDELAQFDEETQNIAGDLAMVELGLQRVVNKVVEFGDKGAIALDAFLYKVSKGEKGVAATGIQGGIANRSPFADTFAAQQSALMTTRTDAYLAAMTRTVEAQEALTKAQNAYDEAVRASGARIAEINAKLQDDLSEAETQRQNELAEAAEKAGEDRVRITEDAEKERARIQKRFDRSFAQAVGDRDALAAKRAEEQRKDELEQLDDRYTDQNKAVDDSLKKQQKIIDDRYKAQVATVNAAAQAAVRAEQSAAQARISALQQGLIAAQTQLVAAKQSEMIIYNDFYNRTLSQAQVWSQTMQLYLQYGLAFPDGTNPKMTTPIIGKGTITGKASGGPVVAQTPYWVGEQGRELFIPATNGRIVPNGAAMNVNLNVSGATTETIRVVSRQQALATFNRVLDQVGVP